MLASGSCWTCSVLRPPPPAQPPLRRQLYTERVLRLQGHHIDPGGHDGGQDRGYISYSTPIAEVGGEFSEHNKEDVTLEDLTRHETGLHYVQRAALKASGYVGMSIATAQQHPSHYCDEAVQVQTAALERQVGGRAAEGITMSGVEARVKSRAYHAVTRGGLKMKCVCA